MSVSLVIVSHSARLAEGVVELAEQMAHGKVAIAAAGGTTDGSLGTSLSKPLLNSNRIFRFKLAIRAPTPGVS